MSGRGSPGCLKSPAPANSCATRASSPPESPASTPAGARAPAESFACRPRPARGEQRHGELRLHGYPRNNLWESRLQNSLGCGLNSRFPGEHSVVLDCRLRVLGREDSSGEPRSVERRPSTCLHRHRWMTGPGRAPALDRRLADDTLFVTSPGARAGRRSAPARRTCSGTSPLRRRGRGHGDRRTRP